MRIICAYNVNLDALHNISGKEASGLMNGLCDVQVRLPEKISSNDDFLVALLFCMKTGSGVELLIDSPEVANSIKGLFSWEDRLGGNAGNMANALAALGAEPVLNVPALTQRLASLLSPEIRIPKDGGLAKPSDAVRDEKGPVHFVLQFGKGEVVRVAGQRVVSPRENRLIATYDELNGGIYTDPQFDSYCRDHLDAIDGGLVGGFHLVPLKNYRELLDRRIDQIESWRRGKQGLFIHAEMGNFQRPEIMMYLMKRLHVDSIGMNEDELSTLRGFEPGWKGVLDAARGLRSMLGIARVCIHTRDYILSILGGLIDPEREIEALSFGADVAATLVTTGMIMRPLSGMVNPAGAAAMNEFCHSGARRSGRGAILASGDEAICMVPSQLVSRPRITVGLGDVMTASTFYIEALSMQSKKMGYST
jgi:ADP-dependent phosphofructokinase/glucokinase